MEETQSIRYLARFVMRACDHEALCFNSIVSAKQAKAIFRQSLVPSLGCF